MAEETYEERFARAYLDNWGDGHVLRTLAKLDEYEDRIHPPYKKYLMNIIGVSCLGSTFTIEFNNVPPTDNSQCHGAVRDFLKAYCWERGFVNAETDVDYHGDTTTGNDPDVKLALARRDIFGRSGTEFSGLVQRDRQPQSSAPAPARRREVVVVSMSVMHDHADALAHDGIAALRALAREVGRRNGTHGGPPTDLMTGEALFEGMKLLDESDKRHGRKPGQ